MVAIRELRADLAAHVRRAASGQQVVITVDGRAVAELGPLTASNDRAPSLDALVAGGLLVPPRRRGRATPRPAVPVWSGIRLDRALRDVRG